MGSALSSLLHLPEKGGILGAIAGLVLLYLVFAKQLGSSAKTRLPPSPKALPLIGHLHLM
jgi:hypothetical protein